VLAEGDNESSDAFPAEKFPSLSSPPLEALELRRFRLPLGLELGVKYRLFPEVVVDCTRLSLPSFGTSGKKPLGSAGDVVEMEGIGWPPYRPFPLEEEDSVSIEAATEDGSVLVDVIKDDASECEVMEWSLDAVDSEGSVLPICADRRIFGSIARMEPALDDGESSDSDEDSFDEELLSDSLSSLKTS
jgi:hypothetical protein